MFCYILLSGRHILLKFQISLFGAKCREVRTVGSSCYTALSRRHRVFEFQISQFGPKLWDANPVEIDSYTSLSWQHMLSKFQISSEGQHLGGQKMFTFLLKVRCPDETFLQIQDPALGQQHLESQNCLNLLLHFVVRAIHVLWIQEFIFPQIFVEVKHV